MLNLRTRTGLKTLRFHRIKFKIRIQKISLIKAANPKTVKKIVKVRIPPNNKIIKR